MNEFDDLARKFILPNVEKNIEKVQKQTDQSGEAVWDSFGHFINLSNEYEDAFDFAVRSIGKYQRAVSALGELGLSIKPVRAKFLTELEKASRHALISDTDSKWNLITFSFSDSGFAFNVDVNKVAIAG